MLFVSFIAYTTAVLNIGLGVRVYRANRGAAANRLFLLMCILLCFWGVGYAFMIVADSPTTANAWRIFSAVGWCFFYSVFVLFAISLTEQAGWLEKPAVKLLLQLPAVVFFAQVATRSTQGLLLTEWGWIYLYTQELLWQTAFIIYYTTYALVGFWLIYRWGRRSQIKREKQQAKLMVRSMLAVYIVGAPFDTYLPLLGYPVLPIAILLSTLFVAGIWYAITRYKLMSLDFDTAADHILQNMIAPVLLIGNNSLIREVNTSFLTLTGFSRKSVIGKSLTEFVATSQGKDIVLLLTQDAAVTINCQLISKTMTDEFGDQVGQIVYLNEIDELKHYEELLEKANEELEHKIAARTKELELANLKLQQENADRMKAEEQALKLANFDVLTGLPNRRKFYDHVKVAVVKAEIYSDSLAVVFVDLDNFKSVNDSFGHLHGDLVLAAVADRMKTVVRKEDHISRIGGDEFLLLMEGMGQNKLHDLVTRRAMMLRQLFEEPFLINNRESFLSASIGIAVYPQDGCDVDTLIQNADMAMYAAKREGSNKCRFCSQLLKSEVFERNRIRSHLLHAIENKELELYYQPQVDIKSWKISGVEALLRWRMNKDQFVPPARFIPIAEETDLIIPIGQWVMEQAVSQLNSWHGKGFSELKIAVNLSPRQVRVPEFVDNVLTCLAESNLAAHNFELEITESQALNNDEQMLAVLNQLKQHNIGVSIDDFGTDYSSFMNMKQVSFDRLKIAKEFVAGIGNNKKDEAILRSIIELTHQLDLKVIAEGVETAEEFAYLQQAGCDEVQGYYFFRPMPAVEMEQVLNCWVEDADYLRKMTMSA